VVEIDPSEVFAPIIPFTENENTQLKTIMENAVRYGNNVTDYFNIWDHFTWNPVSKKEERVRPFLGQFGYGNIIKLQSWRGTDPLKWWLTDEHIDPYMNILREKNIKATTTNSSVPCCYMMTSRTTSYIRTAHTTPVSKQSNFSKVRRLLRPEKTARKGLGNIKDADMILMPISNGAHWYLFVIDVKNNEFHSYDSGGSAHTEELQTVRDFYHGLITEFDPDNTELLSSILNWPLKKRNCPRQTNGNWWDCGVFVCNYGLHIVSNLNDGNNYRFEFLQSDMKHLRCRMCLDICQRMQNQHWPAQFQSGFATNNALTNFDFFEMDAHIGKLYQDTADQMYFRVERFDSNDKEFTLKHGKRNTDGSWKWLNGFGVVGPVPVKMSLTEIQQKVRNDVWVECTPVLRNEDTFTPTVAPMSPQRHQRNSTRKKEQLRVNFDSDKYQTNLNDEVLDESISDGKLNFVNEYFGSAPGRAEHDYFKMQQLREAAGATKLPNLHESENGDTEKHQIKHEWNLGSKKLVRWKTEEYFFSKCFPFLFMPAQVMINGKLEWDVPTDFNCKIARNMPIKFGKYAQHLAKIDPRFMAHPILKFVLLNIKNREQLFSQINYMVRVCCSDCAKLKYKQSRALTFNAQRESQSRPFLQSFILPFSQCSNSSCD